MNPPRMSRHLAEAVAIQVFVLLHKTPSYLTPPCLGLTTIEPPKRYNLYGAHSETPENQ